MISSVGWKKPRDAQVNERDEGQDDLRVGVGEPLDHFEQRPDKSEDLSQLAWIPGRATPHQRARRVYPRAMNRNGPFGLLKVDGRRTR